MTEPVTTPGAMDGRPPTPVRRRCIVTGCAEQPRYPGRDESAFCAFHDDADNPETKAWQQSSSRIQREAAEQAEALREALVELLGHVEQDDTIGIEDCIAKARAALAAPPAAEEHPDYKPYRGGFTHASHYPSESCAADCVGPHLAAPPAADVLRNSR